MCTYNTQKAYMGTRGEVFQTGEGTAWRGKMYYNFQYMILDKFSLNFCWQF